MAELKDSGSRRNFDSGAVRDIAEGKGRCDLLPLREIGLYLNSDCLYNIGDFIYSKDINYIHDAIDNFLFDDAGLNEDHFTAILEVAKQYEDGAKKYSERNWEKGIPTHCFVDSGVRHYLKFMRGDIDEPHDRAFVWNMVSLLWTLKNKPELDDIKVVSDEK